MPQIEDVASFLPQVFWLVITFTALFLIMWKIAVPAIANTLEARQKRMEDNLDKAAQAKKEAEETLAAYESAMAEARAGAQGIINEATKLMSEEAEKREAKMAEELGQTLAASEAEIRKAIDAAMEHVRDVAVEVAGAALKRLTGDAPDEKDLGKAVDQAMKAEG
jgi:F-type H+-transporting ATPase subunit b